SEEATHTLTIKAVDLQDEVLVIGGTTGNDQIVVRPGGRGGTLGVWLNGVSLGQFEPEERIEIYGQAGGGTIRLDEATIRGKKVQVSVPAVLDGGTGQDVISAAGSVANNILLGRDGNDTLTGGQGRDLLIGGSGLDVLYAQGDGDLLIGGSTI